VVDRQGIKFPPEINPSCCRVKEWRVTLCIPLAVSTVSSFVPASVRYRTSPSTASAETLKMILLFYLGKLLVISRNLHADVKIHFRGLQEEMFVTVLGPSGSFF
jgi:hypothetical protein